MLDAIDTFCRGYNDDRTLHSLNATSRDCWNRAPLFRVDLGVISTAFLLFIRTHLPTIYYCSGLDASSASGGGVEELWSSSRVVFFVWELLRSCLPADRAFSTFSGTLDSPALLRVWMGLLLKKPSGSRSQRICPQSRHRRNENAAHIIGDVEFKNSHKPSRNRHTKRER
jgi:hypothetical protein